VEDIGRKLRTLRKGKKLTQQDVADRLGLVRATVSNYEVGKRTPHLSLLKKFADFYGVTLDYFGVTTNDEIFELLSRAREVFNNDAISTQTKEELYKEFMRLYLNLNKE
jgi:transcriptional regulator with XRE-family HTH domain